MASIGDGWEDGAWIQASWITGAWAAVIAVVTGNYPLYYRRRKGR